tara:strand:- start:4801 stop:5016 length:216 start_codon:yes stop_codon:yes gene_type:complete
MATIETKDYTAAQTTAIRAAFSFLTEEGTPATDAQIKAWVEAQIRKRTLMHYRKIEDVAAAAAARVAIGSV